MFHRKAPLLEVDRRKRLEPILLQYGVQVAIPVLAVEAILCERIWPSCASIVE
jgi:hypothetical protein